MKVNVGGAAGNDINFVAVNFLLKSSPERLHVSRVKQMELFTVFQVKKTLTVMCHDLHINWTENVFMAVLHVKQGSWPKKLIYFLANYYGK